MISQKDSEQDEITLQYEKTGGCGTLEAVTGFGKTRTAIKIIKRLRRDKPERSVAIIVPTIYLKNQWEESLKSFSVVDNIKVLVINTAIKQKLDCSLLVLDEIHRYAAKTFSKIFGAINYSFILGLTARLKRSDRKHPILAEKAPIFYKISMEEARIKGYIAEYSEYNLGIGLPPRFMASYKELEEKYIKCISLFMYDFSLMVRCTGSVNPLPGGRDSECSRLAKEYGWKSQGTYLKNGKQVWGKTNDDQFHPNVIFITAINGVRAMSKLKTFLNCNSLKPQKAVEILEKLGKKAITFSENIETADEITRSLSPAMPSASYYSGMKGVKKGHLKAISDSFLQGKLKVINSVKALDTGADFPDVELGIRVSGSASETQHLQRRGRILRENGTKKAIMVNLYLTGTKDEEWLKKSQGNDPTIEWINDINQIKC